MDICSCGLTQLGNRGTFTEDGVEYCVICCKPTGGPLAELEAAEPSSVSSVRAKPEGSWRRYVLRGFFVAVALLVGIPILIWAADGVTVELRETYRGWTSDEPAQQACEAVDRWKKSEACQGGFPAVMCTRDVDYLVRAVTAAKRSDDPTLREAAIKDDARLPQADDWRANLLVSHSSILEWCEGH